MSSPSILKRLVLALIAGWCIAAWSAFPAIAAAVTLDDLFAHARDAAEAGDYARSGEYYEEILRRDRTNLDAMLELSSVYQLDGRLEYARGLLIRATRIDPGYPGIGERRKAIERRLSASLTTEIDSLIARGDCEAAIPRLSLYNTIDPGNASVHYKRALCLFEMGRLDAALSDIDVAIAAAAQEPYFVLRDRVTGEMRRHDVRRLVERAKPLVRSDDPLDRAQALDVIGRILEMEPRHEWANEELARLNRPPAPDEGEAAGDGGASRKSAIIATARTLVDRLAPLGRFIDRHLSALVALVIVVLVFRSPMSAALSRRLSRRALLAGDLSRFSLAEVLTMLNAEPHTGVLQVRAKSCRGTVYFDGGEPCHCIAGKTTGVDALLALVDKARSGRFEYASGGVPLERTIDMPLSILLVEEASRTSGVSMPTMETPPKKSRMKELLENKTGV